MRGRGYAAGRALRGLFKLVFVVVAAGAAGGAIGIGISKLSDKASGTSSSSDTLSTSGTPQTAPTPQHRGLKVTIIDAVLHPAATPAGARRRRARLTVRIRASNPTEQQIVTTRPSLTILRRRVDTDRRADGPGTVLGTVPPRAHRSVTLRFETAGSFTAALERRRMAQLLIAGRHLVVRFDVGNPVRPGE